MWKIIYDNKYLPKINSNENKNNNRILYPKIFEIIGGPINLIYVMQRYIYYCWITNIITVLVSVEGE